MSQQDWTAVSQADITRLDWALAAASLWTAAMVAVLVYLIAFAPYPS